MSGRRTREILMQRQYGVSPITGESLCDRRVEIHHKKERHEGGDREISNLLLLPIEEHFLDHIGRSLDVWRPRWQRRQEYETVVSRLEQLTDTELRNFFVLVESQLGIHLGIQVRWGNDRIGS